MGFFWRRNKDKYTTLGLNDQGPAQPEQTPPATTTPVVEPPPPPVIEQPPVAPIEPPPSPAWQPPPVAPPPAPVVAETVTPPPAPVSAPIAPASAPAPRSSFSSSILGLDLSMEELQERELALEQEFSARFRKAVAKTRDSLGGSLDNIFQSRKKIDDELLDALEEALISADIGVSTTVAILDKVRRGVSREQIKDLDALKQAIKVELLKILQASDKK